MIVLQPGDEALAGFPQPHTARCEDSVQKCLYVFHLSVSFVVVATWPAASGLLRGAS